MTWSPPRSFEERLKAALIPPGVDIWRRHRRALAHGEPELRLVPFLANRAKISLDVGANKGVYAYALLAHSAAVHAFEPNPKMFEMLRRWGGTRVHLHQMALGAVVGEAELLVPKSARGYSNQGASLSAVKVAGEHRAVTVKVMRLDDLNLADVGFMKIDVEGFEREVLRGAAETLRRQRPNLLIEMEERHTKTPLNEMVAEVCGYGYACYALVKGSLTPFSAIDIEARHLDPHARRDYLFNFVFLPV